MHTLSCIPYLLNVLQVHGAKCRVTYRTLYVTYMRTSTESVPVPDSVPGTPGVSWHTFDPVECDEVVEVIQKLPNKSCAANPVPTSVLKQLADDVAPFLTALFNRVMTEGVVPAAFKCL